ncbi:uncharacterized protein TNCV_1772891 [Trichonephila clavipes]|nr:uncharacterized protein TNCV_1772891 [Trichonephila clavipes]
MMERISIHEVLAKRNEIDPFLKRMVTGDEKWVSYYNIVRKGSRSKCGEAAQVVAEQGLMSKKGLGSNPGEDMDVCNCIEPERHGAADILSSRRAASPLVRFVEGEERWEASDHPQSVLPLKWGRNRAKSYCHLYSAQGHG